MFTLRCCMFTDVCKSDSVLNEFLCRSQMISVEDCEFIKKFEVANSEEKQIILTNEAHQVSRLNVSFPFHRLSVYASDAACFRTVHHTKWKQGHCSICKNSLSSSCCIDISVLCFSVCKDLSEPNGSHLQGADSPVHPDSDWWHSAGTDRSTVLCQIIHIFTLTW